MSEFFRPRNVLIAGTASALAFGAIYEGIKETSVYGLRRTNPTELVQEPGISEQQATSGNPILHYDDRLIIVMPKKGADKASEEDINIARSACKSEGILPLKELRDKRWLDVDTYYGKIPWQTSTAAICDQGSIDPDILISQESKRGKTQ